MPVFFESIDISGTAFIPSTGPLLIAPMHRSRWDGLVVGYALAPAVFGRTLRFMVTDNEMQGLQGWLIRQMGGFSVDPDNASLTALRQGLHILKMGESLVIFPEGDIICSPRVQTLKPGVARLALQAQRFITKTEAVQILPVALHYEPMIPQWGCRVRVAIAPPLNATQYTGSSKTAAATLTADLKTALNRLCPEATSEAMTSDINSAFS